MSTAGNQYQWETYAKCGQWCTARLAVDCSNRQFAIVQRIGGRYTGEGLAASRTAGYTRPQSLPNKGRTRRIRFSSLICKRKKINKKEGKNNVQLVDVERSTFRYLSATKYILKITPMTSFIISSRRRMTFSFYSGPYANSYNFRLGCLFEATAAAIFNQKSLPVAGLRRICLGLGGKRFVLHLCFTNTTD